jgi:hypothetical protein
MGRGEDFMNMETSGVNKGRYYIVFTVIVGEVRVK